MLVFGRKEWGMARLPYLWDYDLTEAQFYDILAGRLTLGRLDRDWAAVRLLDYAPYRDIVRLLGYRALVEGGPGGDPACALKAVDEDSIFWYLGYLRIIRNCLSDR